VDQTITVQIEQFLLTGEFGSVCLGMSREQVTERLGSPEGWHFAFESDQNPDIYKYGDVQLYFASSEDNRLIMIAIDDFKQMEGAEQLLIDPWKLHGGMSLKQVTQMFDESNISYELISRSEEEIIVPIIMDTQSTTKIDESSGSKNAGDDIAVDLFLCSGVVLRFYAQSIDLRPSSGLYSIRKIHPIA
jgi:hypothetical protein